MRKELLIEKRKEDKEELHNEAKRNKKDKEKIGIKRKRGKETDDCNVNNKKRKTKESYEKSKPMEPDSNCIVNSEFTVSMHGIG